MVVIITITSSSNKQPYDTAVLTYYYLIAGIAIL
jgi:hypothetical protein